MDVINQILSTYMLFFDWKMWVEVLTDPVSWGLILSLVIIEGLLSADNALVLAVLVKHLPEKLQKKALMYGIIGAYIFRFIAIGIGIYLVQFSAVKILGAAYLAWIVFKYFKNKADAGEDGHEFKRGGLMERLFGTFWATVISVEIMDIAFSIDSVLAAFAISDKVWVLLMGGMLGIIMMRTVAGVFLKLINKIPELEDTAFILIGIISAKMFASVFGFHMHHYAFFGIIVAAFGITYLIHLRNVKKAAAVETAVSKED